MKKLIAVIILGLITLITVPVSAQSIYDYPQNNREWNRQDRHRGRDWNRSRTYVRNEYRYVRLGRTVYRETYRTTYRNGRIVRRILVNRERIRDNRSGFRFNIYIPF